MNPCETCPIASTCDLGHGCAEWRTWFLSAWQKFNEYARAHGLEIEEIKHDEND